MSKQDRPDGKWSFGRRTALKLTGGIALGSASAGAAAADSKSGRKVEGSISFEDRCKTVCIETKPDAWWTVEVEFTSGRTKTYTDDKDKCLSFDRRIKRAWLYKGEDSTEGRELDSARCRYNDHGRDGKDGRDGRDGKDSRDGRDGKDGRGDDGPGRGDDGPGRGDDGPGRGDDGPGRGGPGRDLLQLFLGI